jgi:hypothetical protein
LLFADNMYEINMHARTHLRWCFSWLTRPCFHLWFLPPPLHVSNILFYLLGDPSSYTRGANIHPLSSLVSYQLFSPCCLTRPEETPQIKLHIYIDNITTSAAPSDTISLLDPSCRSHPLTRCTHYYAFVQFRNFVSKLLLNIASCSLALTCISKKINFGKCLVKICCCC